MGGERCPGESDCFDFQASLGANASLEAKRDDACAFCPMLPTKPKPMVKLERGKDSRAQRRFDRIRHIRQARNSGYPLSKSEMTTLDFNGLLILDDAYERFQRQADAIQRISLEETAELLQVLIAGMMPKS
jgi:hypothetical protein